MKNLLISQKHINGGVKMAHPIFHDMHGNINQAVFLTNNTNDAYDGQLASILGRNWMR